MLTTLSLMSSDTTVLRHAPTCARAEGWPRRPEGQSCPPKRRRKLTGPAKGCKTPATFTPPHLPRLRATRDLSHATVRPNSPNLRTTARLAGDNPPEGPLVVRRNLNLAVLGGDGIGPEVTDQAFRVLEAAADLFGFDLSGEQALVAAGAVLQGLPPLPDQTLSLCKSADAILFGAVGDPRFGDLPPDQLPERALLHLRKGLDLYANLRPVRPFKALFPASSLKPQKLDGVDILIVRELVSGVYFGQPRGYGNDANGRFGFNTMWYHESEVRRIGRVAFKAAQNRRKSVLSCDKANALESMQLWRETMAALAKAEFPDLSLKHMYVDNCAMQLIQTPAQFDVIVAGNLFGDIISDIGAQLTGSLGMLPSASIGDKHGLYEPVHGSAPDIAGRGIANPLAAILSAAMLLEHAKGWTTEARAIEAAVEKALESGLRTSDIATGAPGETKVGTAAITDAVITALRAG